jgi:DNA-binding protein HU-beta
MIRQNYGGMKMNKTELINAVSAKSYQTKAVTAAVVDAIFETIQNSLSRNEAVQLSGFGGFETFQRAAKEIHHPGTGISMIIPTKKVVKFKAGKILSNTVAGSINVRNI